MPWWEMPTAFFDELWTVVFLHSAGSVHWGVQLRDLSVRPSLCPHDSLRKPLDGFKRYLVWTACHLVLPWNMSRILCLYLKYSAVHCTRIKHAFFHLQIFYFLKSFIFNHYFSISFYYFQVAHEKVKIKLSDLLYVWRVDGKILIINYKCTDKIE